MFNRTFSWNLQRAIERHGLRPQLLWKNSKYQVGHTYWSGYRGKYYRVLEAKYDGNYHVVVTVEWQDGTKATHRTGLHWQSDWELFWPEGKQFEIQAEEPVAVEYDHENADDFAEFDFDEEEIA